MPPVPRDKEDLYTLIKTGKIRVTVTTSPALHRFWKKVDKNGPVHPIHGQCWVWLGSTSHNGYGQFMINHSGIRPHRYSYEVHVGPIPNGLDIMHKCDNRLCVNPDHLGVGTKKDNITDKVSKGRHAHGETISTAKLTNEQVYEIRRRYNRTSYHKSNVAELAKEFNVNRNCIIAIVNRETWNHLK